MLTLDEDFLTFYIVLNIRVLFVISKHWYFVTKLSKKQLLYYMRKNILFFEVKFLSIHGIKLKGLHPFDEKNFMHCRNNASTLLWSIALSHFTH